MPLIRQHLYSLVVDKHKPQDGALEPPEAGTNKWLVSLAWYPTDLFGATSSLLEKSGAFGFYEPNSVLADCDDRDLPSFTISDGEKDELLKIADQWRSASPYVPPTSVMQMWIDFYATYQHKKVRERPHSGTLPSWWLVCAKLLIISDEASRGIGIVSEDRPEYMKTLQYQVSQIEKSEPEVSDVSKQPSDPEYVVSRGSRSTFAKNVNPNHLAVFPKSVTSTAGCSHRNFSNNLALLPSTGSVRCHWHLPSSEIASDDEAPIDILVVPYPFDISGKDFLATRDNNPISEGRTWENFKIDQGWLDREDPLKLVESLLKSARQDVHSVNGLIFPEFSINYEIFEKICSLAKAIEPDLEFVIAGANSNCEARGGEGNGNHVLTCVWHRQERTKPNGRKKSARKRDKAILSSRRKHHRWKMDARQLSQYALSSSLDPRVDWWEDHQIGQRELHFFPFRQKSIFTSMICEDLARSDPCHEVLRSVGPNLVFVLLMDGPQLKNRWSARSAAALSEDPGSSVLTLTSFGLINRSNNTLEHRPQRSVAFFSSPYGQTQIQLPDNGAKGVLISLTSELNSTGKTIDNRSDNELRTWRFASSQPVLPLVE